MLKNEIGSNAGKIWQFINSNGECTFKELKKELNLKESELYLAIGWLANERKIEIFEKEGSQMYFLIY